MPKPIARYSVAFGLRGCFMPDSYYGFFECSTRRELSDLIRSALEHYELPKSLFREVGVRRLWSHIKRHGSSVAHFSLRCEQYALSFHGLTEEELNRENEEEF